MEPVGYVEGLPVAARAPGALHTNIQVAHIGDEKMTKCLSYKHTGKLSQICPHTNNQEIGDWCIAKLFRIYDLQFLDSSG